MVSCTFSQAHKFEYLEIFSLGVSIFSEEESSCLLSCEHLSSYVKGMEGEVVSVLRCRLSFYDHTFHHHLKHSLPLVFVSSVSLLHFFHENKSLVFSEPLKTRLQSERGDLLPGPVASTYQSSNNVPIFSPLWSLTPPILLCSKVPLPFWEFYMGNIHGSLLSQLLLLSPFSILQSTIHFHFQVSHPLLMPSSPPLSSDTFAYFLLIFTYCLSSKWSFQQGVYRCDKSAICNQNMCYI